MHFSYKAGISILALFYCLQSHSQIPITAEAAGDIQVVKIGVAAPMTGQIAHLGKAISRGVALAVDRANRAAYMSGARRLKFEVVEQDDAADPRRATPIANALIASNVLAVVGHLNSGLSIPASRVYAARGIPMVSPASSNPNLTEQKLNNVFRVVARDDMQPNALFEIAREIAGKRVAILSERGSYGEIVGRAATVQAESRPLKIVLNETELTPDRVASSALGERLAALEVDAILVVGSSDLLKSLLKAVSAAKAKPLLVLATDYACTDDILNVDLKASRLLCASPDPDAALIDPTFSRDYERKYGEVPHAYAATAYDATSLIVKATSQGASMNPVDIAMRLRTTSLSGATGSISFDSKGDRVGAPISVSELSGGRLDLKYVVQANRVQAVARAAKTL